MKFKQILKFTLPIVFFCVLTIFVFTNKAEASTSDNIFGKAWSENIGWISFNNCTNPGDASTCGAISYGVNRNGTIISGYAWNDNVGWISFTPTDWGTCPPSASGCNLSTFSNVWGAGGWGRAISATNSTATGTDAWDGWISLGSTSGTTYSAPFGTTNVVHTSWGSSFTGQTVYVASGYVWGAGVVGWVNMNGDSGSNYNPANGGVFIIEIPSNLTLTPSATTIISGDTVDFAWSINNFTPTSCTGSGTGTDTDWTTVQTGITQSSGTYTGIHVPIDTTTVFTLSCTDGIRNASANATIIATPLAAGISYPWGCAAPSSTPTLNWSVNDATPSCQINAETTDHSTSYSFGVSGTSPGAEWDTNFQNNNKNTQYVLSCTNGSGAYEATSTSGIATVNVCQIDYTIAGNTSCDGNPGATVANNGFGTYVGTVTLTLNPLYGFISNASVSGSASTGTLGISPVSGFIYDTFNSLHDTVDVELSLTSMQYATLLAGSGSTGVLEEIMLTITGSAQNTTPHLVKIKFCANTASTTIKPIFKPF